jgi:hypothetical protein
LCDATTLNLLHDLPLSRNQPLKSADDWCVAVLKNKMKKLGSRSRTSKNQKVLVIKIRWVSQGRCSYICVYTNAVPNHVMLTFIFVTWF